MTEDTIAVALRVRPAIKREKNVDPHLWKISGNEIYVNDPQSLFHNETFTFDYIFDQNAKNKNLYELVHPLVQSTLQGYNATVFAYGQTSSGKTHSILGNDSDPGIIPLAAHDIFSSIFEKSQNSRNKYTVRLSYFEIYNEKINDLLDLSNKDIKVREDHTGNIFVKCHEEVVINEVQMLETINKGSKYRQIGGTSMNERSSRSHVICDIVIESCEEIDYEGDEEEKEDGSNYTVRVAHLYIIDLAGSERVAQTGATGQRYNEGVHINKSLSTLITVITQLSNGNTFISFRDSKLTRLLTNSLGGNCRTLIVATMTKASLEDSISTLKFARSAKLIKNKPKVNDATSNSYISRYRALKKKMDEVLDEKNGAMEMLTNKEEEIISLRKQLQPFLNMFVIANDIPKALKSSRRRHTMGTLKVEDRAMETIKEEVYERRSTEQLTQSSDDKVTSTVTDTDGYQDLRRKYDQLDESHAALKEFTKLEMELEVEERTTQLTNEVYKLKQMLLESEKNAAELNTLRITYECLDVSHANLKAFTQVEMDIAVEEKTRHLVEEIQQLKKRNIMLEEMDIVSQSQQQQHQRRCTELLSRIEELETEKQRLSNNTSIPNNIDEVVIKQDKRRSSIKLPEIPLNIFREDMNKQLSLKRSLSDSYLLSLGGNITDLAKKDEFQNIYKSLRHLTSAIISDDVKTRKLRFSKQQGIAEDNGNLIAVQKEIASESQDVQNFNYNLEAIDKLTTLLKEKETLVHDLECKLDEAIRIQSLEEHQQLEAKDKLAALLKDKEALVHNLECKLEEANRKEIVEEKQLHDFEQQLEVVKKLLKEKETLVYDLEGKIKEANRTQILKEKQQLEAKDMLDALLREKEIVVHDLECKLEEAKRREIVEDNQLHKQQLEAIDKLTALLKDKETLIHDLESKLEEADWKQIFEEKQLQDFEQQLEVVEKLKALLKEKETLIHDLEGKIEEANRTQNLKEKQQLEAKDKLDALLKEEILVHDLECKLEEVKRKEIVEEKQLHEQQLEAIDKLTALLKDKETLIHDLESKLEEANRKQIVEGKQLQDFEQQMEVVEKLKVLLKEKETLIDDLEGKIEEMNRTQILKEKQQLEARDKLDALLKEKEILVQDLECKLEEAHQKQIFEEKQQLEAKAKLTSLLNEKETLLNDLESKLEEANQKHILDGKLLHASEHQLEVLKQGQKLELEEITDKYTQQELIWEEKVSRLQLRVTNLNNDLSKYQNLIDNSQDYRDRLQTTIESLKNKELEVIELTEQLKESEYKRKIEGQTLSQTVNEYEDAVSQITILQEQIKNAENKHQEVIAKLNKPTVDIKRETVDRETQADDNTALELAQTLSQMQTDMAHDKEQQALINKAYEQLQADYKLALNHQEQLQQEIQQYEKQVQDFVETKAEEIDKQQEEQIDRLDKDAYEKLLVDYEAANIEIIRLKEGIVEMHKEHIMKLEEAMQQQQQTENVDNCINVDELKASQEELQEQLKKSQKSIKLLEKQLQRETEAVALTKEANANLRKKYNLAMEEVKELEEEISKNEGLNQQATDDGQLRQQLKLINKINASHMEQLDVLQQELRAEQNKYQDAKDTLGELQLKYDAAREEIEQLQYEISKNKVEMSKLYEDIAKRELQITENLISKSGREQKQETLPIMSHNDVLKNYEEISNSYNILKSKYENLKCQNHDQHDEHVLDCKAYTLVKIKYEEVSKQLTTTQEELDSMQVAYKLKLNEHEKDSSLLRIKMTYIKELETSLNQMRLKQAVDSKTLEKVVAEHKAAVFKIQEFEKNVSQATLQAELAQVHKENVSLKSLLAKSNLKLQDFHVQLQGLKTASEHKISVLQNEREKLKSSHDADMRRMNDKLKAAEEQMSKECDIISKKRQNIAMAVDTELATIPEKLSIIGKLCSLELDGTLCLKCASINDCLKALHANCVKLVAWEQFTTSSKDHNEIKTDLFEVLTDTGSTLLEVLGSVNDTNRGDVIRKKIHKYNKLIENYVTKLNAKRTCLIQVHKELLKCKTELCKDCFIITSCKYCELYKSTGIVVLTLTERINYSIIMLDAISNGWKPLDLCVDGIKTCNQRLDELMMKVKELSSPELRKEGEELRHRAEIEAMMQKYRRAKKLAELRYEDVKLMTKVLRDENYIINFKVNPIQIVKNSMFAEIAGGSKFEEDDNPRPIVERHRDSGRKSLGTTPKHFSAFFATPDEHKEAKHEARRHK